MAEQIVPAAELAAPVTPPASKPATIAEIKALCLGADSDFVVAQIEAGATESNVLKAYSAHLLAENKKLIEAAAKPAAAAKPGVPALGAAASAPGTTSDDPITAYKAEIRKAEDQFKGDRGRAASFVAKTFPELRAAYIAAVNQANGYTKKGE